MHLFLEGLDGVGKTTVAYALATTVPDVWVMVHGENFNPDWGNDGAQWVYREMEILERSKNNENYRPVLVHDRSLMSLAAYNRTYDCPVDTRLVKTLVAKCWHLGGQATAPHVNDKIWAYLDLPEGHPRLESPDYADPGRVADIRAGYEDAIKWWPYQVRRVDADRPVDEIVAELSEIIREAVGQ